MLGLSLAMTLGNPTLNAGGGYSAEAAALFARMSTQETPTVKRKIDDAIVALKDASLWDKLDHFSCAGAFANAGNSLLNWKGSTYDFVAVNAPTFTASDGWQGDGLTSYLESNFNPVTAVSPKFTLNSAHMFYWAKTSIDGAAGGTSHEIGNAQSRMARTFTTSIGGRSNSGVTHDVSTGAALIGHIGWSRTAAGARKGYRNATVATTGTEATTALTSTSFRALATTGVGFGTNKHAAHHWGSALSDADVVAIHGILNTLLS